MLDALAQAIAMAEKQCQSVDRLEGEDKNKVINMCPKCVCLGKSLMVNFLNSSEKKKLHIVLTFFLRLSLANEL